MGNTQLPFKPMDAYHVTGKRVLLRIDINSPIDPETRKIVNTNRIDKSLPTIAHLLDAGAQVAIIAHQGDTLDYHNLIPLEEHARILTQKLGRPVTYIDDVCGPAACDAVKALTDGEAIILGNLRYLTEEVSTFEQAVKLSPSDMTNTYLVRRLAPLFDLYVNDAFAAAHRNAPSMTGFQEVLPSAAGPLLFREVEALTHVMQSPDRPCVFVLGGAKISDAFSMLNEVLSSHTADRVLTCGVTGEVFLIAAGYDLGTEVDRFLSDRSLKEFIAPAKRYLQEYPDQILMPSDLAYRSRGKRTEAALEQLPLHELFLDIGEKTIARYREEILSAGTVCVNGPAGLFEDPEFSAGTRDLWQAIQDAPGYTVIGGGDTVNAAHAFTDPAQISYICTAGGAMVRFLSGIRLPLIEAMERSGRKS